MRIGALLAMQIVALAACTPAPRSASRAPRPAPVVPVPGQWSYEIAVGAGGRELSVEAAFPPTGASGFEAGFGIAPFVRGLEVDAGATWRAVHRQDERFVLPECAETGCRVRYRIALAEAAQSLDDQDVAIDLDGAYEAPPSTWLLRPERYVPGTRVRFHVVAADGAVFFTGVPKAASRASDTFEATARELLDGPYAVFGEWHIRQVDVAGGQIDLAIAPTKFGFSDDDIAAWVKDAADDVARYYGRYPPGRALVIVAPGDGRRITGTTMGSGGAAVLMRVGRAVTREGARENWVLTHELIHTCFPSLGPPHGWMEEGLATYLEPVVRARSEVIDTETFWRDLVAGLPQGLPRRGDLGLERTHTWGRTYWGGAIFWLLADLAIRERSANARSLNDVLRAVAAAGGTVATTWDIARVIEVGDAAAGAPVLRELYDRLAKAPGGTDLHALWRRLGVEMRSGVVSFDDGAPLSDIRRSITRAR